jgi:hypothetical protein
MMNANREIYIHYVALIGITNAKVRHLQNLLKIENDISGLLKEMLALGVKRASTVLEESEQMLLQIRHGRGDKEVDF